MELLLSNLCERRDIQCFELAATAVKYLGENPLDRVKT